jgi:excisionase family DNA binding protein
MPDLDVVIPNRADRRKRESNRGYELRPLRYSTRDVAMLLRCTNVFVLKLIKSGHLKAQGSRRKVWITAASLEEYFSGLPDWRP